MADIMELQEELCSVDNELRAVEFQIQELRERQQQLIDKKTKLKKKIERHSQDSEEGSSAELDSSPKIWDKQDFPWSQKVKDVLYSVFKMKKFRLLQLSAINATMSGKDTFLVMPTGGGKSLCYQLPAVCSDGFTLVICPLVSLMEDQLMVLKKLGISAVSLNASSSKEHVKWVHSSMIDKTSDLKLIYVTPEKISKSKMFMSKLEKAYQAGLLTRIAVDEVHCCSQWGHDFRPDYKVLGILKRQFPNAPLIGLTATATSNVLKDSQKILCIEKNITFTAPFDRPNLYYEVRQKPSSAEDLIEDIAKLINGRYQKQSGIIYCFSQKDSEQITFSLKKLGIKAEPYHANMDPVEKTNVHKQWTTNAIQVVVATVAFGMGIDKPDVRFVIHHSMSKSMENYYQESGRAGRDDGNADCILYYGFADIFRISTMVVMENVGKIKLYEMVSYCLNPHKCRRALMAQHFDEVWETAKCNKMCDSCRGGASYEKIDITSHAKDLIKIMDKAAQIEEKLTPLKLIDAWLGKGASKLRVASVVPPKLSKTEIERIVAHLILQQYMKEDFSFTPYATISYLRRGPKADVLKNDQHSVFIRVKSTSASKSEAFGSNEDEDCTKSPQSTVKEKKHELKRPHSKENERAKKKAKI
ncbi:ATP-dependent DNA helicase Q1 [Latimeria chalumnae]|uniref:ATP-dependent DNA helicase Q1 n=1 Tax=Latimeria chalumnae TaxID=7897 RepID=UPI0003C1596B|nr:PREDICTED: ATP-dependent DNA helicase Q1 isoform X1 [Latimeria chalumnae]XP_014345630.1 PREDICTED: ATP-dependent DNA helicase Q1 isoform X1 [Latimeria chalumnae]|eukprot:XP_005998921.1 PREDICTED: ATP-dependent DNA helicase Q1 isoform X1 [Latimeria chalumnae]